MDYTNSPDHVVHAPTGRTMHEDSQALPTVVSDRDMNQTIWEMMTFLRKAGVEGKEFNPDDPETYEQVYKAVKDLFLTRTEAVKAGIGADLAATNAYADDLNLLDASGEYYFKAGATTQSQANAQARHAPMTQGGYCHYGLVKVWRETSNIIYQQFHSSTNHFFIRYRNDLGGWNPWVELLQSTYTQASIGNNGFNPSANGVIEQWGLATTTADGFCDIVFPAAFPNSYFTISCMHIGALPVAFNEMGGTATKTGVRVRLADMGGLVGQWSFRWTAKGN